MFPYYNTPFEIYQKKLRGTGTIFIRRFVLRCVPADYTVGDRFDFSVRLAAGELLGRVSVSIPLKRTARDRNPALSTFLFIFKNVLHCSYTFCRLYLLRCLPPLGIFTDRRPYRTMLHDFAERKTAPDRLKYVCRTKFTRQ